MKNKFLIFIVIILLFSLLFNYIGVERITLLLDQVKNHPYAPLIFIVVFVVATIFGIPCSALGVISGVMFGVFYGFVYVTIASTLGCYIAFGLASYLGKDYILKKLENYPKADQLIRKLKTEKFFYLIYIRMIPIFPFALVNYVSGVIGMKFTNYAFSTFIGMLVGNFVSVFLGANALEIQDLFL